MIHPRMNRHIKLPTQQVLYLLAFADVLLQYGILMAMAIKKQTNIQVLTLHTTTTTKHTHTTAKIPVKSAVKCRRKCPLN